MSALNLLLAIVLISAIGGIASATQLSATPSPFTLSNTIIDVGQYSFANTVISGGTGPYGGEYSFIGSNSAGNNVVNTITGFSSPGAIAFNPSGTLAYVADSSAGTVNVINVAQNKTVNTITGFSGPLDVVFNPSGTLAYVATQSTTVNVINVAQNKTVNTITGFASDSADDVAFSPSGTFAYAASFFAGTVNVINVAQNKTVNTIKGFSGPVAIAVNPSGTLAYVTNFGNPDGGSGTTVNVINLVKNKTVNTITGFLGPEEIAINPQGTLAYVPEPNSGTVNVINLAQNKTVNTITGFSSPFSVAFNPSGTLAYVTDSGTDVVYIINVAENKTVNAITGFSSPDQVAINPQGTLAYESDGNATVNVIALSETPVQRIHTNNALPLTIYAASNSTIMLTFNGVQQTFSTGNQTVYGDWIFYGFANDSLSGLAGVTGLTGNALITLTNTIEINSAPSVTLTSSSSSVTPGQTINITATVNGGTGPFTVELYNATGLAQQGSNVIISRPGGSNSISFAAGSNLGTLVYNAIATEQGTTYNFAFNSIFYQIAVQAPTTIPCVNGCYSGSGGTGASPQPSTTIRATTTVATNTTTAPTTAVITTIATTVIPATTTIISSTTTVVPTVTVDMTTPNATITVNVSSSQPYGVHYTPSGASFVISSPYSTSVDLTISNMTSTTPAAPANYTKFLALNVSINSRTNVSAYATIDYPCNSSSGSFAPFILKNGVWEQIHPFTEDSTACTISFSIPNDPVVALMQSGTKPASTTTVTSTNLTTAIQQQSGVNKNLVGYAAAAVIIAIAIIAYLVHRRRRQSS